MTMYRSWKIFQVDDLCIGLFLTIYSSYLISESLIGEISVYSTPCANRQLFLQRVRTYDRRKLVLLTTPFILVSVPYIFYFPDVRQ